MLFKRMVRVRDITPLCTVGGGRGPGLLVVDTPTTATAPSFFRIICAADLWGDLAAEYCQQGVLLGFIVKYCQL
jgi:hypothetical protein